MNGNTVSLLRDLFQLEWKMLLFSYIEHREGNWNRNLDMLHTESCPLISYSTKRSVQ